jgi:hypothetical protein
MISSCSESLPLAPTTRGSTEDKIRKISSGSRIVSRDGQRTTESWLCHPRSRLWNCANYDRASLGHYFPIPRSTIMGGQREKLRRQRCRPSRTDGVSLNVPQRLPKAILQPDLDSKGAVYIFGVWIHKISHSVMLRRRRRAEAQI